MDEDSFRALWDAHYADILAFCLRRLGDRHEAADAAVAKRSVALPGNPIPAGTVVEDSTFSTPAIVGAIGERP